MVQDHTVLALEAVIYEVRSLLISLKLKFNDIVTEVIVIGTRQQVSKVDIASLKIGSADITPSSSVRNLGAWFDDRMAMNVHVGMVCKKAFRGLYNIRQIRKIICVESTNTLIHAFVTCHLDYCNSLLYGIPQYSSESFECCSWSHVSCSSIFTSYQTSPRAASLASHQTQTRI